MAMSAEQIQVKICSPSPYEWKIVEWDDKPQTNKQKYEDAIHLKLLND